MDDAKRRDLSEEEEEIIGPALPPHLRQKPSRTDHGNSGHGNGDSSTKVESSKDSDVIGPALPPHLRHRLTTGKSHDSSDDADDDNEQVDGNSGKSGHDLGPALPPHLMKPKKEGNRKAEPSGDAFGAKLPPDYSRWNTFDVNASDNAGNDDANQVKDVQSGDEAEEEEEEEEEEYGPALPPGFEKPPSSSNDGDERTSSSSKIQGPTLLPGAPIAYPVDALNSESSDDDEMIGPMPLAPGKEAAYATSAAEEFEKRSRAMKEKLITKDQPQKAHRDSWMTELPGYSTNFGLGSRTFRKTARPEDKDRSGWTDTPADREKKEKERAEKKQSEERVGKSRQPEERVLSERDKKLSAMVSKHNETKRGESLVNMHTKDRKRKLQEEEEDKPKERRPFDRDLDLKVNQFDDAQRKLLIKKSAQLNEKFSHSKEKMFL